MNEPDNHDLKISKSNEEKKINLTIFAWGLGIGAWQNVPIEYCN